MASKKVFELMEAENWNKVMELLTNTSWTSQDLDEKHWVRALLAADYSAGMRQIRYSIILLHLKISGIWDNSLFSS